MIRGLRKTRIRVPWNSLKRRFCSKNATGESSKTFEEFPLKGTTRMSFVILGSELQRSRSWLKAAEELMESEEVERKEREKVSCEERRKKQ